MTQIILITGGAGFVGSSIAILLKKQNPKLRIIALDNLKRRGSELNLPRFREHEIEFIHGDIRNPEDLCIENIDLLIECSAEPSVLAGYGESPAYLLNTNLLGTINCLELARRCHSQVLFLSTSRIYPIRTLNQLKYEELPRRFQWTASQNIQGASEAGISESFPLDGARSLYGTTKLASELIIQEYQEMYGVESIINRCGLLAGPWQMGKSDQGVITLWAARHYFEKELSYIGYNGSGKQVRDVLHIDDLFDLLLHQIHHFPELSGEIFNVGGGAEYSVSLKELTQLCQEASGKTIPIAPVQEERPADLRCYVTDCSKVTEKTGWKPTRSPQKTVEDIMTWIQQEELILKPLLGA